MKIAHIFISLPVGGAEDLVLSLARQQSMDEMTEVVCLRELGVAGEEAAKEGLPVTLLPCARSKRLSFSGIWRLARWLREQRVDAVHSHVYNAHVYSVIAAAIAGIPSIIHHHKTFKRDRLHRLVMLRLLSRLASAQIALSATTRRELITAFRIPCDRFHVFENCVDSSIFHPATDKRSIRRGLGLDEDAFILGAVASLTAPKNHFATVEMFSALRKRGIEAKGIVCGEGHLRPVLQEQIDALRLQPHLQLVGNKRPITPWLQAMDLLVLPSTWEGQPMILLQAMACHIPIIASDIEGNVAALGADHPGLFHSGSVEQYTERVEKFFTLNCLKEQILSYQADFLGRKASFVKYAQDLKTLYYRCRANS